MRLRSSGSVTSAQSMSLPLDLVFLDDVDEPGEAECCFLGELWEICRDCREDISLTDSVSRRPAVVADRFLVCFGRPGMVGEGLVGSDLVLLGVRQEGLSGSTLTLDSRGGSGDALCMRIVGGDMCVDQG